MLYNSLSFLVFFVLVFASYWTLRGHRARLVLLLVASWLFYAAWYPRYLVLFLAVTAVTYGAGIWIADLRRHDRRAASRAVVATVVLDLAMLAYFKYANFLLGSATSAAGELGVQWHVPQLHVILPLGISFYTFQSIAYVIDVNRGEVEATRNPLKLALFKAFFPQLIAGPIVRASELVPQFASARRATPAMMLAGLDLVAVGLFKKVMIADQIAPYVDRVFANPTAHSTIPLLLGIYGYAAQIYCDFSGYTDIGRGCARLLGYELPPNFDHPYLSVNIVDFWRRWHMTLSRWLRDYLYIPLGGSRQGRVRTYVNLLLTMVLGGLWHGAAWTFVVWGLIHGVLLAVTRLVHDLRGVPGEQPLFRGRAYRWLSIAVTFHLVCIAWVFFRAPTLAVAMSMLRRVARVSAVSSADIAAFGWVTLGVTGASLVAVGLLHVIARVVSRQPRTSTAWLVARSGAYAALVIALTLLASRGAQQFIYFQF